MPDSSILELRAARLRLEIAPQVGGSIASFYTDGGDGPNAGRVDWLRPATPDSLKRREPLAMASFPLLPFCNRIRDGRASFEGREIRFPPNHPAEPSPHPLHGLGWQREWGVAEAGVTRAVLTLQVAASEAWPWRFSARQELTLSDQLQVTISLTNEDSTAMPAGLGHHPYFPHTPGTRLTAATAAMWQTDAEVMPTRLETAGEVSQLRRGVVLDRLDLDNNFAGWEGTALLEWPADRQGPARSLLLQAAPPLEYFVLYCPRGFDHFCAEPVSQCTDWLNLLQRHGQGPLGGARLPPGQTLQAHFSLTPRWA